MKKFLISLLCIFATASAEKYALLSVYDKTGIQECARSLLDQEYTLLSTGGTFKKIQEILTDDEEGRLVQVSDYTGSPEILDGRVKTLHPKIFGGLLARRDVEDHMNQLKNLKTARIDVVVVNLYPFKETAKKVGITEEDVREQIDIGGVALLRAAAKNSAVTVIVDPEDYQKIGNFSEQERKKLAAKAYRHTALYDAAIAQWMEPDADQAVRVYQKEIGLKYGCNPHQKAAGIYSVNDADLFFETLNGSLGYINVLDAIGSWNLVKEVDEALHELCFASFKHTSPAGVALAGELSDSINYFYNLDKDTELSDCSCAFLRARNGDPKSSFGDFLACSRKVDVQTAELIKKHVSDGIIAPDFEPEALEILKKKKKGAFIILKAKENSETQNYEFREIGGLALMQKANNHRVTKKSLCTVVTDKQVLTQQEQKDGVLASVTMKYTQSNSVVYAYNGQVIGVGAGQQSRIDCVKLAGKKADIWWTRNNPGVIAEFKDSLQEKKISLLEKVNGLVAYAEALDKRFIDGEEHECLFETRRPCVLASDAFFPFKDNIEEAARHGVQAIIQPGGSVRDHDVIDECNKRGMVMAYSGVRLFTH